MIAVSLSGANPGGLGQCERPSEGNSVPRRSFAWAHADHQNFACRAEDPVVVPSERPHCAIAPLCSATSHPQLCCPVGFGRRERRMQAPILDGIRTATRSRRQLECGRRASAAPRLPIIRNGSAKLRRLGQAAGLRPSSFLGSAVSSLRLNCAAPIREGFFTHPHRRRPNRFSAYGKKWWHQSPPHSARLLCPGK